MVKYLFRFVLFFGIVVIAVACLLRFFLYNNSSREKIITSSTLTDTIDIADLSTAEFRYKGIADVYTDETRVNVCCRVCYNAIVKAWVDMNDIQFDIDNQSKVVTATLPAIKLKVTLIDEDAMSILPSDANVGIESMLRYSTEDAENEVNQSKDLIDTARNNLKATIEGLLYPILETQEYSLIWADR